MSFQSYYKEGYLYLDYPNIENISDDDEKGWDLSISEMNKVFNVYNECEKMYLCTDFYWRFPKIFLNFKKLKHLTLDGTRWFYIDCDQLPKTLEYLDIDSINVNIEVLKGMDKLEKLNTICVDFGRFFGNNWFQENLYETENNDINNNDKNVIPFYNHESLEKIIFHIGTGLDEDELKIDLRIILKNRLFDNIRHRITNINIEYDKKNINNIVISLEPYVERKTEPCMERRTMRKYGEKCECTSYPYMCKIHTTD